MIRAQVTIEDNGVSAELKRLGEEMKQAITKQAEADIPAHANRLREMIIKVVYNAYQPRVYTRNYKLLAAPNGVILPTNRGVDLILFNDTEAVIAARGPFHPKGGSRPEEVPEEIEEGRYPPGWMGFTAPRPAYHRYAQILDRTVEAWTDEVIAKVLS